MRKHSVSADHSVVPFPDTRTAASSSLRFIKPTLPEWETVASLYRDIYNSGVITNAALVERLESAVAEYIGVKHCIAVSSCTSGLILTMKAFDLRGEVILPSFTFFASGEAILWNGLRPVFADCELDTWNIDPADVARRVTPRTAAILGVHLYGNPSKVEEISCIAERSDIKLIFDAAHAFGSLRQGVAVGGFGDAEVFSLSPTKLLVAGEGGLVTTNDSVLARRLRAGRNYGDLGAYDPELLGMNARMSEFNAALALAGLEILANKIARHGEIAALYTTLLSDLPGVRFQAVYDGNVSTYKDFSIHVSSPSGKLLSSQLCAALQARNIPTKRYFYPPLHQQQIFAGLQSEIDLPLPVTEFISEGVVSLPIYESLPDKTVETIAATVREIVSEWNLQEIEQ